MASYLPAGLADLAAVFAAEEEDVLRVHMDHGGRSGADISYLHRYVSDHASQTDYLYHHHHHESTSSLERNRGTTRRMAHPIPLPHLGLNQHQNYPSDVPSSSTVDPSYFAHLRERRHSSSDQPEYNHSNPGGPGPPRNDTPPQDFDEVDVETVKQSISSESQALYGNESEVKELKPEYVRWFYKYEQDRKWTPFTGYDSIRMELRYRNLLLEREELQAHQDFAGQQDHHQGYNQYGAYQYEPQGQYYSTSSNFSRPQQPAPVYISTNTAGTGVGGTGGSAPAETSVNAPITLGSMMSKTWSMAWNPSQPQQQKVDGSLYLNNANGNGAFAANYQSYNANCSSSTNSKNSSNNYGSTDCSNIHDRSSYPPGSSSISGGQQQQNSTGIGNAAAGNFPRQSDLNHQDDGTLGEDGSNENVIIVRGGLYEADLESWNCVATYWPGDKCQLTRGTWFYDGTWQPLSVEHAEKLEEEHLGEFGGVSLLMYANASSQPESPTKKSSRPVVHRVSFLEFHVDWTSPTDIHLYSKAASHKFMRSVGQRLGFQTWGHRLCRGYFKPASLVDRPSEISHLVFVVHGIGQKMDTGRIVRNCASFRETVTSLKDKFFPHLNETKQRAEFFPVEWRSAAKLDGDVVDAITPHKLLSLRQLLNATAMDIMYYTSPLYRTEIQNALRNELNRIYANFVKRNPDFQTRGGKVSVIAHSLGAVITYDIITGYMSQPSGPDPSVPYGHSSASNYAGSHGTMNGYYGDAYSNQFSSLLFGLEHFFCLGSPLSVFLALRWREPHNPDFRPYILPRILCKRIYNVFYPTDPVAYRVEPLLNKHYVHIAPLPIHSYGSSSRTPYDEMPLERINKEYNFTSARIENVSLFSNQTQDNSSSKSTPQRCYSLKSPPTPTRGSRLLHVLAGESNWGWFSIMKYLKSSDTTQVGGISDGDIGTELLSPDGNSSPIRDEGNSSPEEVANEIPNDLDYRMDYVLKESNFSSTYLAALTSHTSYWSSPDTAFFVLTRLHEELLDSPQQAQAP